MPKRQIEIEILAKGKPAERSIDKVDKKTKKLGDTTDKQSKRMTASWAKVGLSIAAVTAVVKKAVEAHAVQLKAEVALSNALRLNAKEGEATLDMWKKYASGLQEVTLFGDEATLQQIALLKTMGLSDEMTRKTIEAAMDYATAFGKDMPSAVRELTMTLSGQIGTIKRTIPSIGDFSKEQLKSGEVIDKVAELMKGQAKALADTPWGETQQAANSFGDELERLGASILEFASSTGATGLLTEQMQGLSLGFRGLALDFEAFRQTISDPTKVERISFLEEQIALLEEAEKAMQDNTLLEFGDWIDGLFDYDIKTRLKEYRAELNKLTEDIKKNAEEANKVIEIHDQQVVLFGDLITNHEDFGKVAKQTYSDASIASQMYSNALDLLRDNADNVANDIATAFADMIMGVETSFEDMAKSIIHNLIRIRIQALITQAITGFFRTPTVDVGTLGSGAEAMFQGIHTGGAVGLAGIPSFHTGVRSDERLAKLQVGEAVINRGGAAKNRDAIEAMNKGYSVGGMNGQMTTAEINFNVQAIDANSFNSYLVNNRDTITGIINESLVSNGSVRRTIKTVI